MSAVVRIPRGRRGTAAALTALVAAAVLAWGAAEAVSLAMHRRTFWISVHRAARFGRDTQLSDSMVLIVAIVIFVIGVVLTVVAVVPPRRVLVELTEDSATIATGLTIRSLRRTLAATAVDIDGVRAARVRGRRRLRVTATTALRDVSRLPDRVGERVNARLNELDPVRVRTVRVRLDRKDV